MAEQSKLKVSGVDHVVLHVRDIEISMQFYMDVLGAELRHAETKHNVRRAFLRIGSQGVDLFEKPEISEDSNDHLNHLAFNLVEGERPEVVEELAKFGIKVHGLRSGTHDDEDLATIHFYDPDGHRIQLLAPSEQKYKVETIATEAWPAPVF